MERCHRPPPGVPAPRPRLQPFCLCLCGAVLRWPRRIRLRCVVNPGAGSPKHRPERTQEKDPKLLGSPGFRPLRIPHHSTQPRPGPRLRHSPMSPSSSSSSSSSMFSRTFLVIICMSPRDRRSAALGSARLRSARAASSAQPSRLCPAALRPRSASAGAAQPATEHAQRDAAAPAPDQTAPALRSPGGSRAEGAGGVGQGRGSGRRWASRAEPAGPAAAAEAGRLPGAGDGL